MKGVVRQFPKLLALWALGLALGSTFISPGRSANPPDPLEDHWAVAAGQLFGPTPGITNRKDQSLVPVGPPICVQSPDHWLNARAVNPETGLYGACMEGYPADHQRFIVDKKFVGKAVHFAAYGPPMCQPEMYLPYYSGNTCEPLVGVPE